METADIIVVGAGVVGAAIAFGLAQKGQKVLVIDGESGDFRASRANFGLVWVQSKGEGFPAYQSITQQSAGDWRLMAQQLRDITGLPLTFEQNGGLVFCLGDKEFSTRKAKNDILAAQQPGTAPTTEMLDRTELSKLLPGVNLGQEVVGASFGNREGAVNPLELLSSLHSAILRLGGVVRFQTPVTAIRPTGQGFEVDTAKQTYGARKVVLAAGFSSSALASPLGMNLPLRPQRGQILVTERMHRFLPLPASGLRQTQEGTVMIGATQEDVGFNTDATADAAATLAKRATRIIPALEHATIVRQWSGLRILSPDGTPVYAQSAQYPGAFSASCHSGVTLAAFHANQLADAVISGDFDDVLNTFTPERFDVQKCA